MTEREDAEALARAAREIAAGIKRRKKENKKESLGINQGTGMRRKRRNIRREEAHLQIQDHDKS